MFPREPKPRRSLHQNEWHHDEVETRTYQRDAGLEVQYEYDIMRMYYGIHLSALCSPGTRVPLQKRRPFSSGGQHLGAEELRGAQQHSFGESRYLGYYSVAVDLGCDTKDTRKCHSLGLGSVSRETSSRNGLDLRVYDSFEVCGGLQGHGGSE